MSETSGGSGKQTERVSARRRKLIVAIAATVVAIALGVGIFGISSDDAGSNETSSSGEVTPDSPIDEGSPTAASSTNQPTTKQATTSPPTTSPPTTSPPETAPPETESPPETGAVASAPTTAGEPTLAPADITVTYSDTAIPRLTIGEEVFDVGVAGDRVAVGDWRCDGNLTAAILRPTAATVYIFDRWAEPSADLLPAETLDVVTDAEEIRAERANGCHRLMLDTVGGESQQVVVPARSSQ